MQKYIIIKLFLGFLITSLVGFCVASFIMNGGMPNFGEQETLRIIGTGVVANAILSAIVYLFIVGFRISDISGEIQNLINGHKYNKVDPSHSDEVGDFARFFNDVTLQIEMLNNDINNAERLSGEVGMAAKIQSDVIPKVAPPIQSLEIVAKTRSAAEMGGDCFDVLTENGQSFVYIGDVTGHGVPAGLIMMMVNILIRAFAPFYRQSDEILKKVNKIIQPRIASNMFMTLVMLRWVDNDQKMYFTGCGHEYIMHYKKAEDKCEMIRVGGIALGMVKDIDKMVTEKAIDFREGDAIVLYTDGMTEAKNHEGQMYGHERLSNVVSKFGSRATAESIFENITADFADYVGKYADQQDDITMIVIKHRGHLFKQESVSLQVSTPRRFSLAQENWGWN